MSVAAIVAVIVTLVCCNSSAVEHFTAPGLVFNIPSPWWHPQEYKTVDWLVPMYLDQISQPACLSYNRGNPEILNFNASAYQYWRF